MNIDPNVIIQELKEDIINFGVENITLLNEKNRDFMREEVFKYSLNERNH